VVEEWEAAVTQAIPTCTRSWPPVCYYLSWTEHFTGGHAGRTELPRSRYRHTLHPARPFTHVCSVMAYFRPHARVHACALSPSAGFNESAWLAGDASSRVLSTPQLLAEVEVLSDAHRRVVQQQPGTTPRPHQGGTGQGQGHGDWRRFRVELRLRHRR
jgi:hypothetical protein